MLHEPQDTESVHRWPELVYSPTTIPPAWIDQLRPGGLILVHLEGPLGADNLAALRRDEKPVLHNRFLPW